MIKRLQQLQQSGHYLRVGITGTGAMGTGVAWQVARTPGMQVEFLADHDEAALRRGAAATGRRRVHVDNPERPPDRQPDEVLTTTDALTLLRHRRIDALVECTNSVHEAAEYCLAAIDQPAHVVLMNAELDLMLGGLLAHEAARQGVVVTSDAGDQHGVLATMADEILLWGFRIVLAGNMKGFQDRHADAAHARPWAEKQRGSVIQTVSYTDGSKMNIEQCLIGNHLGLTPWVRGMEGPRCQDIREVLDAFDFSQYGDQGRADYTLGVTWPGGGVFIVGHCDDDDQDFLLNYYKITARRPYYLFFRPYHLCHVETPRAIAQACLDHRPIIAPTTGPKLNNVFAHAKKDLAPGTLIAHALGGDEIYGCIDTTSRATPLRHAPLEDFVVSRDHAGIPRHAVVRTPIARDQPITFDDLDLPDTPYHRLLARQATLTGAPPAPAS